MEWNEIIGKAGRGETERRVIIQCRKKGWEESNKLYRTEYGGWREEIRKGCMWAELSIN